MSTNPVLLFRDPRELVANPFNPNVLSPENEQKLDRSIQRNPMFKPVIVRELDDGRLEILGGQHRVESAIRVNLGSVPVFNLGRVDDKRAKEICLVDNNRYGADDTLSLAKLFESLELSTDELESFLPYSGADLSAIFSTSDIDLDDLLTTEEEERTASDIDTSEVRAVKTHQIMRMKVPIGDAERVSQAFERIMKKQGFIESDSLTNAGDALVYLANLYEMVEESS